jgi:quercetin dioxygenase-like cupin family protein
MGVSDPDALYFRRGARWVKRLSAASVSTRGSAAHKQQPYPTTNPERDNMKKLHSYFRSYLAALVMLAAVPAQAADVKELFATDLGDYPGKEGRMIEVSYPPGARDMVHRHDAHAFVYVLEGQIIMQLKGQPAVTLKAGQTFYEGPNDVHVIGRNASNTAPARFVVVLLKAKGAPVLTPVKE